MSFFQHVLTEIFLLSHLRIVTITPCNITYVQISYFVQLVFSFKSSHWICLGLMQSQHKCLKVYAVLSIAPSLTKLFNVSIRQGYFPGCWKTSSVVPVPKYAGLSNITNYRPISLLLIVNKILECHFHRYISY